MDENKGLPVNIDAERFVLGAVMLDEAMMHAARPVLESADFSLEKHRRIWRAACDLYDSGTSVEGVTVATELERRGERESCDGISYLVSLTDGLPQLANIDTYVKLVQDKALLRRVIFAAERIKKRAMSGTESAQDVITGFGETALTLIPKTATGGLQSAGELVDEIGLAGLLRPRREHGLMFPWGWMNHWTSGMLPAELWILAGHTSTGKTSAMLQHAVTTARRGQGVAIFSLEVGKQALFQKACFQLARVDSEKGKRGQMTPEERDAVNRAAHELYDLPLYFDTQSATTMAIHAAVRRRKLKSPVDHVIVDYLQLLGNTGRHDNRAQAVGANAWALKMLATDFGVPVLLLSQFSRASNKPGQQREPELTDLKESGDVENHANGVWFLHRASNEDADRIPVKFMLPKQRDGRRNIYKDFLFLPQYQRFEEIGEDL